jgi:serine/threonine-protein kinase OSR1/STK39
MTMLSAAQCGHAVRGGILGSKNMVVVSSGRYDCSADIWSLGITLLEFALGQAPLQNCNLDQILMKTLNEPPPILESSDRRKRFTEVRQQL